MVRSATLIKLTVKFIWLFDTYANPKRVVKPSCSNASYDITNEPDRSVSLSAAIVGEHWLTYEVSIACSYTLIYLSTSLTVSGVRAANIVRRPCSDYSYVTAPYKLSFYYYYYYLQRWSLVEKVLVIRTTWHAVWLYQHQRVAEPTICRRRMSSS